MKTQILAGKNNTQGLFIRDRKVTIKSTQLITTERRHKRCLLSSKEINKCHYYSRTFFAIEIKLERVRSRRWCPDPVYDTRAFQISNYQSVGICPDRRILA